MTGDNNIDTGVMAFRWIGGGWDLEPFPIEMDIHLLLSQPTDPNSCDFEEKDIEKRTQRLIFTDSCTRINITISAIIK